METVINIIDVTFSMAIAIMMFLCFFSLTTTMSANLYDQSREIGILRAVGVTKGRIRLLFFYEALVLVIASCLLGIFIGTVVGFTMTLQEHLFVGTSAELFLPWKQTGEILALSLVCAFISTFAPASQLVRKEIAAIFRIM